MMSYSVFMSFVDEDGNAERILSKACFNKWIETRKTYPKQPEESFRRVLIGHICGIDRRRPFPPNVEASLLKEVRKRQIWDAFKGTNVAIGIRGFRKRGFHEAKAESQETLESVNNLNSNTEGATSSLSVVTNVSSGNDGMYGNFNLEQRHDRYGTEFHDSSNESLSFEGVCARLAGSTPTIDTSQETSNTSAFESLETLNSASTLPWRNEIVYVKEESRWQPNAYSHSQSLPDLSNTYETQEKRRLSPPDTADYRNIRGTSRVANVEKQGIKEKNIKPDSDFAPSFSEQIQEIGTDGQHDLNSKRPFEKR